MMKRLIDQYIKSKTLAWAESTLRSERYRLYSVVAFLPPGKNDPRALWSELLSLNMAPYARVTLWSRTISYIDWLIKTGNFKGNNDFKTFKKDNARQFKNAYVPHPAPLDFQAALDRIGTIRHAQSRDFARKLLMSGMRAAEGVCAANGTVVGKGNKQRRVYNANEGSYPASYSTFRRHLATVGLKPHDLRKIALTRLVELGASSFELRTIAGWTSLAPAVSYIKTDDKKIRALMERLVG